jgi:6,7-dimethyl-8-ribityllumazine synthase
MASKAKSSGSATFAGRTHEGMLRTVGRRFAIVASRWNDFIGDRLIDGALDALRRTGVGDEDIEIFRCPGAMELPGLTRRVADGGRFDGIICLGVVIRGATPHFDLVVGQATTGVAQIAASGRVAVAFGVLACDTIEQAVERAGTKGGNRGFDAAMVAIEMADLYAALDAEPVSTVAAAAAGVTSSVSPTREPPRDIPRRNK